MNCDRCEDQHTAVIGYEGRKICIRCLAAERQLLVYKYNMTDDAFKRERDNVAKKSSVIITL